jgi:hypothetical protein
MEGSFLAGQPLHHNARVLVNKNCHDCFFQ